MKALWTLFWSVCQMRRGPEQMPYSLHLLLLMLLLNAGLGIATESLSESMSPVVAVGTVVVAVAGDALMLWLLLRFKHFELRYVQSLTAIYGVDFMLGLFALPLVVAGMMLKAPWLSLLVFAQMLLVGWNLGVRGFVYHRALEISIFQANMLSLTLFLLNVFITVKIFPELLTMHQ